MRKISVKRRFLYWFDWNFNFLWYSDSQAEIGGTNIGKNILFGNEVEYSEMTSFPKMRPFGLWKDYRLVGFGKYIKKARRGLLK